MNESEVRPKKEHSEPDDEAEGPEEERGITDSPDQNLDNDSDQSDRNDQIDEDQRISSSDGTKSVSPASIEEPEHKKTNAYIYKPTRRYPNRDLLIDRRRNLNQDNKRMLGIPSNAGRNSSLAPLLRDGGGSGGILGDIPDYYMDDGDTLSTEVTVQFLNAQVRSLKEELENIIRECVDKDEMIVLLEQRFKESEVERTRLQRETTIKDTQIEKLQKQLHEAKEKCASVEKELAFINREYSKSKTTRYKKETEIKQMQSKVRSNDEKTARYEQLASKATDALTENKLLYASLKKEADILKQGQRQAANVRSNLESKLNRALEENERLKTDARQFKQGNKEVSDDHQRKMDELIEKMRKLEKQNTELHEAIKKQMKLILNLKRQKLHVEAATAVQFVEEEFMKALDRGT